MNNFMNTKAKYEELNKQQRSGGLKVTLHQMYLKEETQLGLRVYPKGTPVFVNTRSEDVLRSEYEKALHNFETDYYSRKGMSMVKPIPPEEGDCIICLTRVMYPAFDFNMNDLAEFDDLSLD